MRLIKELKVFFEQGHQRTVRAKRNIISAVVFKAIGLIAGYIYFAISLSYLGEVKFGIFLVIVSIVDWFAELDIGIGHGLRNRMGEAIADRNYKLARGYISTAYFVVGSIFSIVALLVIAISYFLPWSEWLQADPSLNHEITVLVMFAFAAFAIRFIASLVFQIFYALQRIAIVDLFSMLTKLLFLVIIIGLVFLTEESLILFGAAKTFTFALVPVAVGFYYFRNDFKRFKPSLQLVRKSHFNSLFSLGLQFFLIKISMIVIHQTNNFLIARYVSLESVPHYEAAYKYLSIFLLLFVIITNQLWAANVEAYRKGELNWMKKTVRGTFKIWLATIGLSIIMIFISPLVYKVWLQDKIDISYLLTVVVALSISITTWVNMFNLVLNGTGKIRMQMYAWIFASMVNIPISIFLATTLELGTIGIVLGTVISMIPLAILSPIQVRKILVSADKGIWAK
ncbi:MAG: lipopolysaccharide biosynthesis protein [Cyclobacteriaceae bacterium]